LERNFENDFNVLYENNSTSNYLVLRTGIDIINYQAQMLLNNKINGLLAFNINHIGDSLNCFYNVTSKYTLAGFMSRKRFSRDEFLITILNIINNIYQLKNYLLYDNNILLDENFIYVEPESIDIYFVYLPFLECKNDIKSFFIKLIVKLVNFHDEDSDNYIQKILEVIRNDLFSLGSLKALIEKLLGEEIKNQNSDYGKIEYSNTDNKKVALKRNIIENRLDMQVNASAGKIDKANIDKTNTDKANTDKTKTSIFKADKTKADKAAITRGNVRIPNSPNNKNQEQRPSELFIKTNDSVLGQDKENVDTNKKFNMLSVALFLLQPFLLITFIFTVKSNFVEMADNPKNTVAILILIFLSVDVLVARMVNEKRRKTNLTSICKPLQFITNKMKSSLNIKDYAIPSIEKDKQEDQLPIVNEKYNGETVILKKNRQIEKPYLKEKDGEEVIEIDKKSLLIGRMENFVDYVVNSSAVGKIHAEILDEGGEFYLMDCNSRNGTFLNESRIVPNTKNKVNNNDVLRFANKEFIFFCPVNPQSNVI